MALEEGTRAAGAAAGTVATGLAQQPLALALVVINLCFLGFGSWFGYHLLERATAQAERRDAEITKLLARECAPAPKKD